MPNETPIITTENLVNSWVTIRLDALRENARVVANVLQSNGPKNAPRLMAVVKADAYGHGAVHAARAFLEGGAQALAVTTLTEALELTDAGIDSRQTPILVFAPLVTQEQAEIAVERGLHLTVCDAGHVELLRDAAQRRGECAYLHLKVDTGMGRLGLAPTDALGVARQFLSDECSRWAGVYTHFARASEPGFEPDAAATRNLRAVLPESARLRNHGRASALRELGGAGATA